MSIRTLSDIVANEALTHALYTMNKRAIPNMIDGFKPVHRFDIYSCLKNANTSFDKVASIASVVAKYGYQHGETSAIEALSLLGADWFNNVCLVQGRGNFGSRMIQEPGAGRYIYAKLHDNFEAYFKDIDLSPSHDDIEHIPPKFYIPIIPMVVVNGMFGIATGYACNILPHDPEWVIQATLDTLNGKSPSEPVLKFPDYKGEISIDVREGKPDRYRLTGLLKSDGLTVTINELPPKMDHEKYIKKVLQPLKSSGIISSYTDKSSESFLFVVRMKRGTNMSKENLLNVLKLIEYSTQNINVIHDDKLEHFDDVRDLIKRFVDFRKDFLPTRIEHGITSTKDNMVLAREKVKFIKSVISGTIVLHGNTKKMLVEKHSSDYPNIKVLLNMSLDKLSNDEVEALERYAITAEKEHNYWLTATPEKEFKKDLKSLV